MFTRAQRRANSRAMVTLNLSQIARLCEVSRPTAYLIVRREDFPPRLPQRLSLTGRLKPPEWDSKAVMLWLHMQKHGAE